MIEDMSNVYRQRTLVRAIEYDIKECARNIKNTTNTNRPHQADKALMRLRRIWLNVRELEQVIKTTPF